MKKSLLFLFAVLLPLLASAQTKVEIDGIWYNLISKAKQAEVTSGDTKYSGSITIPATVTYDGVDYSVTSIGESAFSECPNLTAITLPEGMTSIGAGAFYYCICLTSITLPEGVTSIGDWAFSDCLSLTAITLPESLTSIGDYAFHWCICLTSITLPEGVTSIGDAAFVFCSGLTATIIPEGVTSIGNSTFSGCWSLTAITLPESLTSIGPAAFWGCSSLTVITIPEGVTSIGDLAFSDCLSLTAITLPEGVTSIGGGAFSGCIFLKDNFVNNSSCTSSDNWGATIFYGEEFEGLLILDNVVVDCRENITTATIPASVTSIGNSAFSGCSSLTTIMLPKSVKSIGSKTFANCSELTDVYCNAETVPSTKADAFDGSYIEYATLHVPASAVNEYKATAPWSSFGKVETLEITVDEITLSQSAAELIEGESLQLTATVSPDDAEDKSISWSSSNPSVATVDNTGKVTAVAPGTATITATANDGSGMSASCEVTVKELILGKCAAPTISYEDGKILLTCDTEGAIIKSITTEDCAGEREEGVFNITPTYTINVWAIKEGYHNSDIATATLCWIACNEEAEEPGEGIINIPSKAVLISTQGGTITLSGLTAGTEVAAYNTAGTRLATATATDDTATLSTDLTTGDIAVVKIGKHSIKVAIK